MFVKPRPKKSILPHPSKKRKYGVEQVAFDFDARNEYLTGFHKRKQQRIKLAQEEAAKKEREEKLKARKQVIDTSS
jgi:ribosomal RNA-processing protein 17